MSVSPAGCARGSIAVLFALAFSTARAERSDGSLASPAQLYTYDRATLEFAHTALRADETVDWETASTRESSSGQRMRLGFTRRASPSIYWRMHFERYFDATEHEQSGAVSDTSDSSRTLFALGGDVAYKIMDELVIGLGAAEHRFSYRDDDSGRHARRHTAWQPAALIKSEWYELGIFQRVYLVRGAQFNGDNGLRAYREYGLHGRYFPNGENALGLVVRRNPFPDCCLASITRRLSYEASWSKDDAFGGYAVALSYEPEYFEKTSFGSVYGVTTYGAAFRAYANILNRWSLGVLLRRHLGADDTAEVEVGDPLNPTETADVKTSRSEIGAFVKLIL